MSGTQEHRGCIPKPPRWHFCPSHWPASVETGTNSSHSELQYSSFGKGCQSIIIQGESKELEAVVQSVPLTLLHKFLKNNCHWWEQSAGVGRRQPFLQQEKERKRVRGGERLRQEGCAWECERLATNITILCNFKMNLGSILGCGGRKRIKSYWKLLYSSFCLRQFIYHISNYPDNNIWGRVIMLILEKRKLRLSEVYNSPETIKPIKSSTAGIVIS